MEEQKRLGWIDIAKGIAIILMVMGHTSIPDKLSNFIFAFHMPLFFMASGLCTNWHRYSFGSFVIRKLRALGVPFLIYSIVVILVAKIVGYQEISFRGVFLNGWKGYALWFVPVLFGALMFAKRVLTISNKWIRVSVALVFLLIGTLLRFYHVSISWTLHTVPYATFLVILGSFLKPLCGYLENPKSWLLIPFVLCLGITGIISMRWRLDLASNVIAPVVPLTLGALSGSLMVFIASSFIAKWSGIFSGLLQAIGKETFIIMAFSQIIIISLKTHTEWGGIIRYAFLIIVLIILIIIKNRIKRFVNKTVSN